MDFLKDFATNQRACLFGATRSGKTFLIKKKIIPQVQRYIIWDMKHEYGDVQGVKVHSLEELKKAKGTRIIYQPKLQNLEADFDKLCYFIVNNMGSVLLIVDEAHLKGVLSRVKPSYWVLVLIKTGAAAGKGVLCISQRPQDTHPDIRTQSEWILTFRLSNIDLDYLAHFCGEQIKDLPQQPDYSHYEFYGGRLELKGP